MKTSAPLSAAASASGAPRRANAPVVICQIVAICGQRTLDVIDQQILERHAEPAEQPQAPRPTVPAPQTMTRTSPARCRRARGRSTTRLRQRRECSGDSRGTRGCAAMHEPLVNAQPFRCADVLEHDSAETRLEHLTVSTKRSTSIVSISRSNTSMSASRLNSSARPSCIGFAARGPTLPRPGTAEPLVITPTRLPRDV